MASLAVACVACAALAPAAAAPVSRTYIVELRGAAAAPARAQALQRLALERLAGSGAPAALPILHRYRFALSGFSIRLTPAQAAALAAAPEVARVTPDRLLRLAAVRPPAGAAGALGVDGPTFLGLPDGLWARLGGPGQAGRGRVIGFVDTGITPTSASFAAVPAAGGEAISAPAGWRGICQTGDGFPAQSCSGKLVGARTFVAGYGPDNVAVGEHLSALDGEGHGTHTAATAAGDAGVRPDVAGRDLGVPAVSGVAPAASVAVYKACWSGRKDAGRSMQDGCAQSDVIAAIDAAVADGVDVLNYSLGGSTDGPLDPISLALLGAASTGVFVSAAAGNEGPAPGTVRGPAAAPWVVAVGASTPGRGFQATLNLRDAAGIAEPLTALGAAASGPLPEAPVVDAATAPAPGAAPADAQLCLPGALDPLRVAGRVVLCRRGLNARAQKGLAVLGAGGIGMILANTEEGQELAADAGWVPTIALNAEDGANARAAIAASGLPLATLGAAGAAPATRDLLAQFSARGPQPAAPDVAKPDLVAPGVNILAASAPTASSAETATAPLAFQPMTGTSMAAPHVAGAAALLMQLHPDWTPAEVRSALMTTANPAVLREDGATPATPFEAGAGRIDPTRAADPGLVLDAGTSDYVRYLEYLAPGSAVALVGRALAPLRPLDLNLPVIAITRLGAGEATARTLTSVDSATRTWLVAIHGLPGVAASASATSFTVAAGGSVTLALRFAAAGVGPGQQVTGAVVLTDAADGRTVRLPVVIVG